MVAAFTWVPTRIVGDDAMENNALELTRPVEIEASQLNASVGRTIRVGDGGSVSSSLGRALFCVAFGLSGNGCFFDCPLDAGATVRVDPTIIGTWRCLGFDAGPTSNPANFVVRQVDDHRYAIVFDEGDDEVEHYEAYASMVKGQTILNVRLPKPKAGLKPWALARYSFLRADVVQVQLVDETKLQGADRSPEVLRQALEKIQGQPDLYGDYCVCVRAKT
jgi:hypothetical protein